MEKIMTYEKPQILTEESLSTKQLYAVCLDTAARGSGCDTDTES